MSDTKKSCLDDLKPGDTIIIRGAQFDVTAVAPLSYGSYQLILTPHTEKEKKRDEAKHNI